MVNLFYPNIPKGAIANVTEVLNSRFVGQGPKVDEFEKEFTKKFVPNGYSIAVGSGTDALHLAYILAGIGDGDEVITPLFTCTATNTPLLYQRAKIVFADIQANTLNIDPQDVKRKITDKTKAIVCVHYGGLPCDMKELTSLGLPVIQDSAHALGAKYLGEHITKWSDYSMFSFQAIKHITCGDGGMLVIKDKEMVEKVKRFRWFGIDRQAKFKGIWDNDIWEVGYKYQMTDIAAALGLAGLNTFSMTSDYRKLLFSIYEKGLEDIPGISMIGTGYTDREHACWLCTVKVENRKGLQLKLSVNGIESDQVHYRNDRYTVFGGRKESFPNMDAMEDKYLVLPLHTKVSVEDVLRICRIIRGGW
jgi:dTDP-4-amino-4,6-dideoxygalactose transaminase